MLRIYSRAVSRGKSRLLQRDTDGRKRNEGSHRQRGAFKSAIDGHRETRADKRQRRSLSYRFIVLRASRSSPLAEERTRRGAEEKSINGNVIARECATRGDEEVSFRDFVSRRASARRVFRDDRSFSHRVNGRRAPLRTLLSTTYMYLHSCVITFRPRLFSFSLFLSLAVEVYRSKVIGALRSCREVRDVYSTLRRLRTSNFCRLIYLIEIVCRELFAIGLQCTPAGRLRGNRVLRFSDDLTRPRAMRKKCGVKNRDDETYDRREARAILFGRAPCCVPSFAPRSENTSVRNFRERK